MTLDLDLEPLPTPDDDEYEPFYPSEKLQIPYGMEIVSESFIFLLIFLRSFSLNRLN